MGDGIGILPVGANEGEGHGEPAPRGAVDDDIEDKHQQIIGVAFYRGDRRIVQEFEVDQPRAAGDGVVDDVGERGIAVGPGGAAEFFDADRVGAAQLAGGGADDAAGQRAALHKGPEIFTGEFLLTDRGMTNGKGGESRVELAERFDLAALPGFHCGVISQGDAGESEIEVGELGDDASEDAAPLGEHRVAGEREFIEGVSAEGSRSRWTGY